MKKRIILLTLLCICMMGVFGLQVWATEYSGTCGENATWNLNIETGVLTISGSGDMEDYSYDSVPWKSYQAYYYGVTSIVIGDGITSIGDWAFSSCDNLTSLTIPDTVKRIGKYAFEFSKNLADLLLPEGITDIDDYAFYYCPKLETVTIPSSVVNLGSAVFADCIGLKKAVINNEFIGYAMFANCISLESIEIYETLAGIGGAAFIQCSSLTSIMIPDGVTSIGDSAFSRCSSLTGISIPNSVNSIGNYAFYYCGSLASITIPNSVTSIDNSAFSDCSNLARAYFLGDAPLEFGTSVFDNTASEFTIYYIEGKSGWTSPTWNGYPTMAYTPTEPSDTLELIVSSTYEIDEINNVKYLKKVQPDTKVSAILSAFANTGTTVRVVNASGTVIAPTDTTTKIGTGYKVQLLSGEDVIDEITVIVKGETNGDGEIDISDIIRLANHINGSSPLSHLEYGKINDDQQIDISDIIRIVNHINGSLPLNLVSFYKI